MKNSLQIRKHRIKRVNSLAQVTKPGFESQMMTLKLVALCTTQGSHGVQVPGWSWRLQLFWRTTPSNLGPLTLGTTTSSLNTSITSVSSWWSIRLIDLSVCEETHLSCDPHHRIDVDLSCVRKNILILRASSKMHLIWVQHFQMSHIYLYIQSPSSPIHIVVILIC